MRHPASASTARVPFYATFGDREDDGPTISPDESTSRIVCDMAPSGRRHRHDALAFRVDDGSVLVYDAWVDHRDLTIRMEIIDVTAARDLHAAFRECSRSVDAVR
jgi:hypothetical protein